MFSQFHHLPVHALAVHFAVVLVPLSALLGILFALPMTRAWSRLPLALVSVAAAVSVFVSKQSGQHLKAVLGLGDTANNPAAQVVQEHQNAANTLFILVLIFTVVALVAVVMARNLATFHGAVALILSGLLLIGSVAVAYQTYVVGELGAKAVWNPSGTVDYG